MVSGVPVDIAKLMLESSSFGSAEVSELRRAVAANPREVRQKCQMLQEKVDSSKPSERDIAALGIGLQLLAKHEQAITLLTRVKKNCWADFYRGRALHCLERYEDAVEAFRDAEKNGYDLIDAVLAQAGAIRLCGRLDECEALMKQHSRNAVSRAEYSFQMGGLLADKGDTFGAVEYFERAVDMDPRHNGALFRLAWLNSHFGNDDEAIQLYERSLSRPPFAMNALLNLGLLYEDAERYDAAAFCFRRVLEHDPNHEIARLYMLDIEASDAMFYDEELVKKQRDQDQTLNVSIADFELSARSRNCLDRMGIRTLGDLTRISEPELLASRNFGETSLKEVKAILEPRGLVIGQAITDTKQVPQQLRREDLSDELRVIYDNPVSELNLSVRSRKCVSRLGIATIGELLNRTPDELLATRNFGVTSLNEIRAKLTEMGVALRND